MLKNEVVYLLFMSLRALKDEVHPKVKKITLFTDPHNVPNLSTFFCPRSTIVQYFRNMAIHFFI